MTVATARPSRTHGTRLAATAVAAAALVLASIVPAVAEDHRVGPEDVSGFENSDEDSDGYNYDRWHIGNTDDSDATVDQSLDFNECSVTTLEAVEGDVTQVMKGFPVDERPAAGPDGTVDELRELLESIEIDVVRGDVKLQVPMIGYAPDDLENPASSTTFENVAPFGPGVHTLQGVEITSSWETGEELDAILQTFQEQIDAVGIKIEIIGVGFTGTDGAEISSISFADDIYRFGTDDCLDEEDGDPSDEKDDDGPTSPRKPERVETGR